MAGKWEKASSWRPAGRVGRRVRTSTELFFVLLCLESCFFSSGGLRVMGEMHAIGGGFGDANERAGGEVLLKLSSSSRTAGTAEGGLYAAVGTTTYEADSISIRLRNTLPIFLVLCGGVWLFYVKMVEERVVRRRSEKAKDSHKIINNATVTLPPPPPSVAYSQDLVVAIPTRRHSWGNTKNEGAKGIEKGVKGLVNKLALRVSPQGIEARELPHVRFVLYNVDAEPELHSDANAALAALPPGSGEMLTKKPREELRQVVADEAKSTSEEEDGTGEETEQQDSGELENVNGEGLDDALRLLEHCYDKGEYVLLVDEDMQAVDGAIKKIFGFIRDAEALGVDDWAMADLDDEPTPVATTVSLAVSSAAAAASAAASAVPGSSVAGGIDGDDGLHVEKVNGFSGSSRAMMLKADRVPELVAFIAANRLRILLEADDGTATDVTPIDADAKTSAVQSTANTVLLLSEGVRLWAAANPRQRVVISMSPNPFSNSSSPAPTFARASSTLPRLDDRGLQRTALVETIYGG